MTVFGREINLGCLGEDVASEFLRNKGYKIVRRNWRCSAGELDLICRQDDELVFVEVKARRDSAIARANLFENITVKKQKRLKLLKDLYLNRRIKLMTKLPKHRVDFIGVIFTKETLEPIYIEHIISGC